MQSGCKVLKVGDPHQDKMTTHSKVITIMIQLMIISVGVFWAVSFGFARVVVFYEAYADFQSTLRDEAWLHKQCTIPEFYSHMRRHTQTCDEVLRNAGRSPVLVALNAVAETANLCGRYTCAQSLANVGWPVVVAGVVTVLFAPMILVRAAHGVVAGGLPRYGDERHLKHI